MTFFSRKAFQRATLFSVALFFVTNGLAAKTPNEDVIEKAYALSLQKDRNAAVSLLVTAAKKETKKSQSLKELTTAIEEVSGVFYSDKAQQLYELALSLRSTDPNLATQKLTEASRLEPENQQILFEQMRLQMLTGDCGGAGKAAKNLSLKNPFSEELKLIVAQAALCSGQLTNYQLARAAADLKKNPWEIFWQTLELESFFRAGTFTKGRELALQLQKSDPAFPETYYWLWKFARELKIQNDREGQKYLAVCKSLSSRAARRYLAEPHLCRKTNEVETELKKINNLGGQ